MRTPNWETWKLAHAYPRIGSGTTPTSTTNTYYCFEEGVPWVTTAELRENYIDKTALNVTNEALQDFSALRIYKPGSLMIAMYGATIGRLGITKIPATCNQACCVFERSEQFDNRFLFYWLWHRRSDLIALSTGGGQPNLSQQDLREERAYCPPLKTQRRIAQFLDEKTARIDGLIEKKRALLERLAEKRQALITRAVTKGLNPDAPMKPSGIDWLGDIPAHWEVIALNKITARITNGYVGPTRDIFQADGVRYIQSLHIKGNRIIFKDDFFVDEEWSKRHSKSILQSGDVLVVQTGDIGQVAHVTEEFVGCNCHALIICRPRSEIINGEFLSWVFCSDYGQQFLHLVKTGALHPHLNCGNVKFFPVVIPPVAEQKAIVSEVSGAIDSHRGIESKIADSILGLEEYRAALITAAVTGQIEGLQ